MICLANHEITKFTTNFPLHAQLSRYMEVTSIHTQLRLICYHESAALMIVTKENVNCLTLKDENIQIKHRRILRFPVLSPLVHVYSGYQHTAAG